MGRNRWGENDYMSKDESEYNLFGEYIEPEDNIGYRDDPDDLFLFSRADFSDIKNRNRRRVQSEMTETDRAREMVARRARASEYARSEIYGDDPPRRPSHDRGGYDYGGYRDVYDPKARIESIRNKNAREYHREYDQRNRRPAPKGKSGGFLGAVFGPVFKMLKAIMKKPVKIVLCLVMAFLLLYFAAVGILLKDMGRFEVKRDWADAPAEAVAGVPLRRIGATNVLVLGLDGVGGKGSRSDTNMLLSINGLTGKVSMVSILRDCYVEVPGHGKTKLNHAHAYAGPALTVQTIERNFRIKIHGVVTLSMDSLPEIVQNMGGVTIEITAAEAKILTSLGGDKFEAGVQFLPPYAAAYFTRIRAIDSDFGRTDRQRRMMLAMVDECKRMGPGRLLKFIQSSAPYVASNMSDISIGWFGLRLGLGMVVGSPNQEAVPWSDAYSGKMVGNMSVVALDLPENVRRLHKLLYIF